MQHAHRCDMSTHAKSDDDGIVVRTRDGTAIRCQRVTFARSPGAETMSEVRWVFSTTDGRQHVGPLAGATERHEELAAIVDQWWTLQRSF
jgi:hypothetical protein